MRILRWINAYLLGEVIYLFIYNEIKKLLKRVRQISLLRFCEWSYSSIIFVNMSDFILYLTCIILFFPLIKRLLNLHVLFSSSYQVIDNYSLVPHKWRYKKSTLVNPNSRQLIPCLMWHKWLHWLGSGHAWPLYLRTYRYYHDISCQIELSSITY